MLTGDARNADPVCDKSQHRPLIDEVIARSWRIAAKQEPEPRPILFRNPKASRNFIPAPDTPAKESVIPV
jgi:pyrroloquinoline quinone biosynthesis protein E